MGRLVEKATVAPGEDNEIYYKMLKWFNNNYPQHMHRYIKTLWETSQPYYSKDIDTLKAINCPTCTGIGSLSSFRVN